MCLDNAYSGQTHEGIIEELCVQTLEAIELNRYVKQTGNGRDCMYAC